MWFGVLGWVPVGGLLAGVSLPRYPARWFSSRNTNRGKECGHLGPTKEEDLLRAHGAIRRVPTWLGIPEEIVS